MREDEKKMNKERMHLNIDQGIVCVSSPLDRRTDSDKKRAIAKGELHHSAVFGRNKIMIGTQHGGGESRRRGRQMV